MWDKSMTDEEWNRLAHTRFTPGAGFGKAGKEDSGTWERLRNMPDQWWIRYNGGPKFSLRLGLHIQADFGHRREDRLQA